jgi:putative ABC transport system permease protein
MTQEKEAFRANIILTDPSVFDVFWFHFIDGNSTEAFTKPFSLVLTESASKRYFGDENPLGKTLEVYCDRCIDRKAYTITGVVEDYPANSHFHFDIIGNIDNPDSFSDWAYYYLKLNEKTDPSDITDNFAAFSAGFLDEDDVATLTPDLQPITDIHLKSDKDREIMGNGNYSNIWLFLGLSGFILFVALFNFINVRQVSLLKNSKTLSVMRIHGASRSLLLFLQLTESFILSIISLSLAIILMLLLLPAFNHFTGKDISIHQIWNSAEWWFVILVLILLSVLTGVYPFLSSTFKSRLRNGRSFFSNPVSYAKKFRLTRIYLSLQFAVSLILIIMVIVVNRQIDYFMRNSLVNPNEQILCIKNIPVQVLNNYQVFKAELLKNPLIYDITSSFENPSDENMDMMRFETIHVSEDIADKRLFVYPADDNFFRFYGIKLLAGSEFPDYYGNDSLPESYILNRKACEFLGWKPEDAIDKPFSLKFSIDNKNLFNGGRIVGVVEDFQMSSMKNEIKPYVFFQKSFWMESVQVKFDVSQSGQAFHAVKEVFDKTFPGFPMQYDYIEDLYRGIYKNENQLKSLSLILGFLAILLSSLGLWGITGIVYQSRTKEIGIRKVNGAGKMNIIIWLLKDINLIVLFSLLPGLPIAYILMRQWLYNYALHISPEWWMFVIPCLFVYMLAIITVFWQANNAAGLNPVESLKHE